MGSHLQPHDLPHVLAPSKQGFADGSIQGSGFRLLGCGGLGFLCWIQLVLSPTETFGASCSSSLEPSGIHRAHIVVEVLQALRT